MGPVLNAARACGIRATGITLSPAQRARRREKGLDVRLLDWKKLDVEDFGTFDGVSSLGAFEHFVSPQEMLAGRQGEIYRDFFRLCAALLPEDARLFLQTMTWGESLRRLEAARVATVGAAEPPQYSRLLSKSGPRLTSTCSTTSG